MTNLLEISRQANKTSAEAAALFENTWLSRYPRPLRCVHDNGPEFQGHDFQYLLMNAGIASRPTSPHTPTANGVIESVHRTIGQVVRTLVRLRPPTTPADANRLVDSALATSMHATRCASHGSLSNISPGALVFRQDMFLDIPFIADIITLHDARQAQIDSRLLRANSKRSHYDYKLDDLVYVARARRPGDKAHLMYDGPFPIIRVHTNNTVTILRDGVIHDRLSIRRLKLHRS